MKSIVTFELAKLLKENGFKAPTNHYYFEDGELVEQEELFTTSYNGEDHVFSENDLYDNWNDGWLSNKDGKRCFGCDKTKGYFETYSAPTIIEAIMWVYETYGIWIWVSMELGATVTFCWQFTGEHTSALNKPYFKSIPEAYYDALWTAISINKITSF